jgi:hypothetical protein
MNGKRKGKKELMEKLLKVNSKNTLFIKKQGTK